MFLMLVGMLGMLVVLYDVLLIFFNLEWGENVNIVFFKKYMGV